MVDFLKLFGRSAVFAVTVLLSVAGAPAQAEDPNIRYVRTDDPEMNAAIAAARKSLPAMKALVAKHPKARPFVKVAIAHSAGKEHIWMFFEGVREGMYVGVIANNGKMIPQKVGDYFKAKPEWISDWMLMAPPERTGAIYGAFTLRVLFKRHPDAAPAAYKARLQPLPK
ncbi:MAG: DUF2314 domain-containing protein [Neomegalonema sp.]|nr:DUF2314 domain-containing protein [Neomegalonema sp.]